MDTPIIRIGVIKIHPIMSGTLTRLPNRVGTGGQTQLIANIGSLLGTNVKDHVGITVHPAMTIHPRPQGQENHPPRPTGFYVCGEWKCHSDHHRGNPDSKTIA